MQILTPPKKKMKNNSAGSLFLRENMASGSCLLLLLSKTGIYSSGKDRPQKLFDFFPWMRGLESNVKIVSVFHDFADLYKVCINY